MIALKPLIYFSLFNHPLTDEEVFLFSETNDIKEVSKDIDVLLKKGIINRVDSFLLLENNINHIHKRIKGKKEADAIMPKAEKVAKFISKFPFIKGVAISGSLSKGYFDKKSDFDFFVITKPKRVWIARLFLAIYKRLVLNNSYKEFCVNYFVSTDTLEIEEKNKFTATEIVTVIPLFGEVEFKDFYKKNNWVHKYFPNLELKNRADRTKSISKPIFNKIVELIFDNPIGTGINYLLMKYISRRWKHRYIKKQNNPYKSKEEISKHHPDNYQQQVITRINERYNFFETEYGINIAKEIA